MTALEVRRSDNLSYCREGHFFFADLAVPFPSSTCLPRSHFLWKLWKLLTSVRGDEMKCFKWRTARLLLHPKLLYIGKRAPAYNHRLTFIFFSDASQIKGGVWYAVLLDGKTIMMEHLYFLFWHVDWISLHGIDVPQKLVLSNKEVEKYISVTESIML